MSRPGGGVVGVGGRETNTGNRLVARRWLPCAHEAISLPVAVAVERSFSPIPSESHSL